MCVCVRICVCLSVCVCHCLCFPREAASGRVSERPESPVLLESLRFWAVGPVLIGAADSVTFRSSSVLHRQDVADKSLKVKATLRLAAVDSLRTTNTNNS